MPDEREATACYICLEPARVGRPVDRPQVHFVDCPACSSYSVTDDALFALEAAPFTRRDRSNASGWLREHVRSSLVDNVDIARLRALDTPSPLDKADRLFAFMVERFSNRDKWYELTLGSAVIRATAWADGGEELGWLVSEVLVAQLGLAEIGTDPSEQEVLMVRITPRGWAVVEQRKRLHPPAPPLGPTGQVQ